MSESLMRDKGIVSELFMDEMGGNKLVEKLDEYREVLFALEC